MSNSISASPYSTPNPTFGYVGGTPYQPAQPRAREVELTESQSSRLATSRDKFGPFITTESDPGFFISGLGNPLTGTRHASLVFDFDKNGSLSREEITKSFQVLKSFSNSGGEAGANGSTFQDSSELSELRNELDPNGDGVLNFQELKNSNARLLSRNGHFSTSRSAISEDFQSSHFRLGGSNILLDVDVKNGTANVAQLDPFTTRAEPSVSKVARIFPLLGRQPSQGDYDFWSEQLDSGKATETTMLASFLEASGRDNRGIVDQLYETVLGQEPNITAAGADAWVKALDGGLPVVSIVEGFINIRDQQKKQG